MYKRQGTHNLSIILNGRATTMSHEQLTILLKNTPASRVEKAEIMYSTPPQYLSLIHIYQINNGFAHIFNIKYPKRGTEPEVGDDVYVPFMGKYFERH